MSHQLASAELQMPAPPKLEPVDALLPPVEPSVSQYRLPAFAWSANSDIANRTEVSTATALDRFLHEYAMRFTEEAGKLAAGSRRAERRARLRMIGIPAFTSVASCRVNTACPFALIGRPMVKPRRRLPAAPPIGNVIVGPFPGALAVNVAGAGGWGARTESLAMIRRRSRDREDEKSTRQSV